ncbi:MAG: 30S ribosomal protein S8, small subunit ribosomal protein S8 [candidate division WS6 bacterium GW2011_GWC1_33_20]|uniref:Small ribosomal subunit protein uS8 n=2 Tax=Candidatus Dojkabacteria TaxID=74243 RepID=A0A0G0CU81_9BACT|nr:ribosomal protein S8 [uncultured bacterium]KKP42861.1 MAG: 30S ribosomal protein S8, small subunit ribosomal protein S8 [candidate division WS6 bacterium GW2011_GWE2_33_157]KKP44553.1 MAG: 30S ribosomal protein S8, small subunit ribosomal protein S8 [candidate division WS6 bacterium GW2011_GWC1_33_20]KKP46137.1 MAG: 30S ribosomal protein S8, small subunit ribosomal protein S8 [candidate division WS6 bacterium GW2011_GWF1_33_233]KKP54650.1 MAG: 30S ribosomal protein S8 [candidate division WS6
MNDLTADLLARLQNGIQRKRELVLVPKTKMNIEILKVLKSEEMIHGFEEVEGGVNVEIMYDDGEPVIAHLNRVSKPGQRIYVTSKNIIPIMNGRGISIISTSHGLMSGAVAKSKKLGGELICKVW